LVTNWEVNDYSNGIAVGTYGYYDGRFNRTTGYIYVVPEASTFLLTAIVTAAMFVWRQRRRRMARLEK
ncbi:PEP-CTERM sorting domain-containing protein, partial [bacterium]|nr:PEP-CTERM sorting domain-containing protein [bacterium]